MLKTRWFVNRQIGVLSSLNYYKSQTPEDGKVVLRTNWLEVVQQPAPSSTVLYRFSSQFKIPKIPACLSTWEWKGWQMEFGLVHHYFERRNVMAGCINGSEWINFGYPIRYMRCGSSNYPKVLKSRYSDHLNLRRRKVFTIRSSINHLKIRDRIQCILAAWLPPSKIPLCLFLKVFITSPKITQRLVGAEAVPDFCSFWFQWDEHLRHQDEGVEQTLRS